MRVLGIESSCDETGIAIYEESKGIIAHSLHSQVAVHALYGGVVPELASRDHIKFLVPLMTEVFNQARIERTEIDAVAYTAGPGLIGALLTGACFAKSFALAIDKPAIAVHHLEAHLLAAMLDKTEVNFPFLALLVSGGHTQLIVAHSFGHYEIIGDTLDDAVGEAFDKTAKLMGFPYPGGSKLAALADEKIEKLNTIKSFPRPMTDKPGLNFSFSGLKTHALTSWNHSDKSENMKFIIANAFQEAVVDTLVIKCKRALAETNLRQLVIAGGVGANQALRKALKSMAESLNIKLYFPRQEYCTDNGEMVAFTGFMHLKHGIHDASSCIEVKARWPLS